MALPVLAGIPWLAGVLGAAFTSVLQFFIKTFTKRFAVAAAVAVSLAALTLTFLAAITAAINGIHYVAPPAISQGMSLLLPSNLNQCLTAIVTAYTVRYVYSWQARIIQYRLL